MLFRPETLHRHAVHTRTFNLPSTMTSVSLYRWKNQRSGNRTNMLKVTQLVSGTTRMCTYLWLVLLTTVLTLCHFLLKHMVIHSTDIVQTSNICWAQHWKYRECRDERAIWDIKGRSGTRDPELLLPRVARQCLSLFAPRGLQRGTSHDCSGRWKRTCFQPPCTQALQIPNISFCTSSPPLLRGSPRLPPPGSARLGKAWSLCPGVPGQAAQQFAPRSVFICYALALCGHFINR